ncbi:MAG: AlkZ-related protein [Pseudobdellovibrio sp.]
MNIKSAISKINKSGILLVFPIKNAKEPDSLWAQFFPRSKMKWEWSDDSNNNKVGDLWQMMKRLSDCRQVVYSKWYQNRATFFSIEVFTAMLSLVRSEKPLSRNAAKILEILEMDSPLSTRIIKAEADLQGKFNEPAYNKAMKELFSRLLIVAYGEVDDGAFPSLAVGATKTVYEDIWVQSENLTFEKAQKVIDKAMPLGTKFRTYFEKLKALPKE